MGELKAQEAVLEMDTPELRKEFLEALYAKTRIIERFRKEKKTGLALRYASGRYSF